MLQEVKIKSNQSIYDVALNSLGGFDNLFYLINNNPVLPNINADLDDYVSDSLSFDDVYYQIPSPRLYLKNNVISNISSVIGQEQQSIYDLCLMRYGSFDNLYRTVTDSKIVSLNNPSVNSVSCNFDSTIVVNNGIVSAIKKRNYQFATLVENESNTDYLLQEDGDDFLLEDNTGKIKLE